MSVDVLAVLIVRLCNDYLVRSVSLEEAPAESRAESIDRALEDPYTCPHTQHGVGLAALLLAPDTDLAASYHTRLVDVGSLDEVVSCFVPPQTPVASSSLGLVCDDLEDHVWHDQERTVPVWYLE